MTIGIWLRWKIFEDEADRSRAPARMYPRAYTRVREATVAPRTVTVATATNVVLTPTPDFWQKRRSVAVNP